MPRFTPYDETITEQQREVQEALMGLPGIGIGATYDEEFAAEAAETPSDEPQ
ncbi:MAG TPA: hypothetical protein VEZ72_04210 [Paenibacillus sp.]|nr:hypothetical protein [Paenibacillus sp.]